MDRMRMLKTAETGRRKAALEGMLRELAPAAGKTEALHIEFLADPMDQSQTNVDRDIAVAELDHRALVLRDVRAALGKIASKGYGECEDCEKPISPKRLDAVPWARLCIACQLDAERRGAMMELPAFDKAA